jgi:hypothetical protein
MLGVHMVMHLGPHNLLEWLIYGALFLLVGAVILVFRLSPAGDADDKDTDLTDRWR